MTAGCRNVAQRMVNAENRFLDFAQAQGLTQAEAARAMATLRKLRILRIDPIGGQFHVTHGAYLAPDVLRRAGMI